MLPFGINAAVCFLITYIYHCVVIWEQQCVIARDIIHEDNIFCSELKIFRHRLEHDFFFLFRVILICLSCFSCSHFSLYHMLAIKLMHPLVYKTCTSKHCSKHIPIVSQLSALPAPGYLFLKKKREKKIIKKKSFCGGWEEC